MTVTRGKPVFLQEEENDLPSDASMVVALIAEYVRLQRILTAADREKELELQIKTTRAQLGVFGVDTEKLDIH